MFKYSQKFGSGFWHLIAMVIHSAWYNSMSQGETETQLYFQLLHLFTFMYAAKKMFCFPVSHEAAGRCKGGLDKCWRKKILR